MKRLLLGVLLAVVLSGVSYADEVFFSDIPLITKMRISATADMRGLSRAVYKTDYIQLFAGERVIVSGQMEITNDLRRYNAGWGCVVKVKEQSWDKKKHISNRATRNTTPGNHHDNQSVHGYWIVPEDGLYIFSTEIWAFQAGQPAIVGKYITVEQADFGYIMVQILD